MFSENLRKLREFRNIDRKSLANILGVKYQTIFQYENGVREPSFDTLRKISSFFGVSIDALINNDEENNNTTKIKNLIKKLNYNFKEFAQDIGESAFEIEKIVLHNLEPSDQIIDSICQKYGISHSEFETRGDKEFQSFCKAEENKDYINLAIFIKENQFEPNYVRKLLNLVKSR
ncbi:helix-turn-helix protein [Ruminiclostridium sufflavum DSM 19573]|uniref:Helix-turn-helix protein n=1 Tax=Ruminiclostridium sufflavum DSM 19573 TaxID=1121337 RepID=A0A318XHU9_9FIRM|nr:helix-turn-helix transcriptional regulator [Ruminiclostridium sufflavum]PYG84266.1 helix-turn-helix protein [Ruminiclostridium sufflavum DSM 19573]